MPPPPRLDPPLPPCGIQDNLEDGAQLSSSRKSGSHDSLSSFGPEVDFFRRRSDTSSFHCRGLTTPSSSPSASSLDVQTTTPPRIPFPMEGFRDENEKDHGLSGDLYRPLEKYSPNSPVMSSSDFLRLQSDTSFYCRGLPEEDRDEHTGSPSSFLASGAVLVADDASNTPPLVRTSDIFLTSNNRPGSLYSHVITNSAFEDSA